MQGNLVIWGDAGEFGDLGGEMQGNLVRAVGPRICLKQFKVYALSSLGCSSLS